VAVLREAGEALEDALVVRARDVAVGRRCERTRIAPCEAASDAWCRRRAQASAEFLSARALRVSTRTAVGLYAAGPGRAAGSRRAAAAHGRTAPAADRASGGRSAAARGRASRSWVSAAGTRSAGAGARVGAAVDERPGARIESACPRSGADPDIRRDF